MAEVIRMKGLAGQLRGRILGKRHYAKICEMLAGTPAGATVILDFAGVAVVSGSWLYSCLPPVIDWAADERNNLFPLLLNVQREWLEEIAMVAELCHKVFLVPRDAALRQGILVGALDRAQQVTFDAVLKHGRITGAELERLDTESKAQATAWNNRLRDLFHKRLINRSKEGREQVYSPILSEVQSYGR